MRHLLYVEDNPADAAIAREALDAVGAKVQITVVENGPQAFDYLANRGYFADAPTPDLVLLDLNLPIMSGLMILAELRRESRWAKLPVVVYTSSRTPADRTMALRLGARFETKPSSWIEAVALAERLSVHLAEGRACQEPTPPSGVAREA
jgi:CheY-like chemotaxis protein